VGPVAQEYEAMPLKELKEEVSQRMLSQVALSQDTMHRKTLAQSATALQKRLRASDEAFDKCFPEGSEEDLLDANVKRLRSVAAALNVTQGDQTRSTLLDNLKAFAVQRKRRHAQRQKDAAPFT